jgi:hypothetical protein
MGDRKQNNDSAREKLLTAMRVRSIDIDGKSVRVRGSG